jgi:ABC-type nitrate/sulfonate/bicarbonate transport system substrate-binding protein
MEGLKKMKNHTQLGRRPFLNMAGAAGVTGASLLSRPSPFVDMAVAADSGAPLNVRVVDTSGDTSMMVQELLKMKGYFDKFGLKAEILNVSDGSKVIGALLNDAVDVCMMSGFSSLLPAIERGATLKVLCGAGTLVGQCLYSAKPDIHELKDLIGKTVGVGSVGALLYEITVAMLRKHGIDEKLVTFVDIGSNSEVFKAVVAGVVDAGPSEIDVYATRAQYGVHALRDGKCWEQIPEYTWQAGYTSDRVIAEKRDILVRTLAAYASVYRYMTGPDSYEDYRKARAVALGKGDNDPVDTKFVWNFYQKYKGYAYNLVLNKEQIDYVQKLNISLGVQRKLLPFDEVADMSIARDALKLLGGPI